MVHVRPKPGVLGMGFYVVGLKALGIGADEEA